MSTVTATFVQATFVLMAFAHGSNMKADPILTKLLDPMFLEASFYLDPKNFLTQLFVTTPTTT